MEFAAVAPVFFFLLFATLAAALDGLYQQLLDDAVRNAARQVQIAAPASHSPANFVSAVCAELGVLAPGCKTNLTFAIQAGTVAGGFASLTPQTLPPTGRLSNAVPDSPGFS